MALADTEPLGGAAVARKGKHPQPCKTALQIMATRQRQTTERHYYFWGVFVALATVILVQLGATGVLGRQHQI